MKQTRGTGMEGFDETNSNDGKTADMRTGEGGKGREGLVLIAIAILFVANVVLYLCHHYNLMHLGQLHPQPEPRVQID